MKIRIIRVSAFSFRVLVSRIGSRQDVSLQNPEEISELSSPVPLEISMKTYLQSRCFFTRSDLLSSLRFVTAPLLSSLVLLLPAISTPAVAADRAHVLLGSMADFNNRTANEDPTGVGNSRSPFLFGSAKFGANSAPFALAAGDFNGDEVLDLAVANYGGGATVSVLLGNGDGTFQDPLSFATAVSTRGVATADLNGDGILDLVTANNDCYPCNNGTVSVLLGNGDGTFQSHVDYPTGIGPTWIATGDFNGDGKVDLVVPEGNGGGGTTVGVLLGNGDGTFGRVAHYQAGINPAYVVTADFSGDNKLDLAVVNNIGSVSILLGQGDGSFGSPTDISVGSFSIGEAAGDFNHDGKMDLAVVSTTDNSVSVLLGNGDGTFQPPVQYATGIGPYGVIAADVNVDHNLDLVVTVPATSGGIPGEGATISVLLGKGDGTFHTHRDFCTGTGPAFLATGHFAHGYRPDLAVTNYNQNSVSILLGNFF